jgi:hypothetical protein
LKIFDIVTCFGKYQYYRFMLDIIILKQWKYITNPML